MRIAFLISGRHAPSSRFRVLQYLPRLQAAGHEARLWASWPEKYKPLPALGWRAGKLARRIGWLGRAGGVAASARWGQLFDVIFVEREILAEDSAWFERRFRNAAKRMVLDVDDAIHLQRPAKMAELAALADSVIVGNEFLADFYRSHARQAPVVVPTCVDMDRYVPRAGARAAARAIVGWMGTASNLPYLEAVLPALRDLASRRAFELRIVTDAPRPRDAAAWQGLDVSWRAWSDAHEIAELQDFDVGLMPLADDEWTRGKCGLKAIQYLAVGAPAVVSPVGVNRQIVLPGQGGYWATGLGEWVEALDRLLVDSQERRRLGAAGRRHVAQHYSIQAHYERWLEAVAGSRGDLRG